MGIDIYLEWDGMTEADKKKQATGFRVDSGHFGYLREAYHGSPYATRVLVREAFETGRAKISAAVMEERLPGVLDLARIRAITLYKEDGKKEMQSFINFVALAKRKETETGKPVTVIASY